MTHSDQGHWFLLGVGELLIPSLLVATDELRSYDHMMKRVLLQKMLSKYFLLMRIKDHSN